MRRVCISSDCDFGYKISSPAGIFTAELFSYGSVVQKNIASDSSAGLRMDGVEVEIMWIPSHVGLEGNEIVDERGTTCGIEWCCF
jgi:hypothetical protein